MGIPYCFECCFEEEFQEQILEPVNVLFCWGERKLGGRVGSCSSTLLCLGLASDFLYVLVEGMYCIVKEEVDG